MVRVWIVYSPHLLADLFERLLQDLASVTVVPHPFDAVDVIVLPLNELGEPELELLPQPLPAAKLVAVSPSADRARVLVPGATSWDEVRPFAIQQLLVEVEAGRARPVPARPTLPHAPRPVGWLARLRGWSAGWLAHRPARLRPALSAGLAVVVAVYYLGVGTLAAAEAAVPGEPLYDLKRLTEQAQLAIVPETALVQLNTEFAERRLEEIEELAEHGVLLPELIEDMATSTEAALNSNVPAPGKADLLVNLAELTRRQQQVLATMQPATPDPAIEAALEHALQVSASGHQQAVAAIADIQAQNGVAIAAITATLPAATSTRIPLVQPTRVNTSVNTPEPANTAAATAALPTDLPVILSSPTIAPSATTPVTSWPTVSPTPTASRTPGPTKTPTHTQTATEAPTDTPTWTPSPTVTNSPTPTNTPTDTPSPTATDTATSTPTDTPTTTRTPAPTKTPSATPTNTEAPTETATVMPSPTDVPGRSADEPTATPLPLEGEPE